VLNPETSSLSPSAKSKGVRLVSASLEINQTLSIVGTTNKISYTWNDASNTWSWDSGLTIPDLTWCMVAVSVTSTAATAYLCQSSGITSAINTVSHTSTTLDDIKIGQDDLTASRFFNGNIATAMIYDRALSAGEITQNFNALRSRYGL
jgi:hypothetical protein